MPIKTDSLNRKLYDLLNSRGYNPVPRDSDVSKAGKIVPPEEADVFKFTFKRGDEAIDDAWVSIDGAQNLTLYYDQNLTKDGNLKSAGSQFDDSWFGLLKFLKKWAYSRQLNFKLEPKEKIDSDMGQRTYMKKKEQIAEGYYPMGKMASYNDNIPTVKIVLQHTRQIQEGEQRYRNIAKIFLENTQGERILAPTTKPGIAQIYARHIAEGGVPNDERWNHIKGLCEEYTKMAGFVRAVRGNQFNESAQRLVEAGLNHYQGLRETLGKMRGHRGYNAYFESWTPTLMETEGDETNLNELFVQETLDPRIESVMPILSKLKVNLGEMAEVNELAEWADNILEAEDELEEGLAGAVVGGAAGAALTKTPGGTIAGAKIGSEIQDHLSTEKTDEGVVDTIKKVGKKVVDVLGGPDDEELLKQLQKRAGVPSSSQHGKPSMAQPKDKDVSEEVDTGEYDARKSSPFSKEKNAEVFQKHRERMEKLRREMNDEDKKKDVEESALQAYLGKKKYGEEGMDALRKAGREHASKEKMAQIRAKYDKLDEEGVAEGQELYGLRTGDTVRAEVNGQTVQGDVIDIFPDTMEVELLLRGPNSGQTVTVDVRDTEALNEQGVAEDLDADQKRVGQLGPYEKVGPKGAVGKLVGSESVESTEESITEMDKSQPSSDRGGESSGDPYAKGGKGTPAKAKDVAKDAEKTLDKAMDKAHKKEVKEGQEDFDYMLRIIRK